MGSVDVPLTVPGCYPGTATGEVFVRLDIDHSSAGALAITLIGPGASGAACVLAPRNATDFRKVELDGNYTFKALAGYRLLDWTAPTHVPRRPDGTYEDGTVDSGVYMPDCYTAVGSGPDLSNTWASVAPQGVWVLRLTDTSGAGGTVRGWGLDMHASCPNAVLQYNGGDVPIPDAVQNPWGVNAGYLTLPPVSVPACFPINAIATVSLFLELYHSSAADLSISLSGVGDSFSETALLSPRNATDSRIVQLKGEYTLSAAAPVQLLSWMVPTHVPVAANGTFEDGAVDPGTYAPDVYPFVPQQGSTWRPPVLESAFTGKAPQGNWYLRVSDSVPGRAGVVRRWGLVLTAATATP